tara:strand:- start:236 stop:1309 length:1074 start_codon:yes stop_codon:yes gene_type:complete
MKKYFTYIIVIILLSSCRSDINIEKNEIKPLIKNIYTADPSVHVFENKIYIYPSHDVDEGDAFDDLGSHFAMKDYHVFSLDSINSKVVDHGIALHVDDVSWATKQMWAPDATKKNSEYFFYFPAKDSLGIFRIGVAKSNSPFGPFIPEKEPIVGSYSIDPAIFKDDNEMYYMYFGGIWGGQLQRWRSGEYNGDQPESPTAFLPKDEEPALLPLVARMSDNLLEFDENPKEVKILDENGNLILAGDNDRRFFEAAWIHKFNDKYYLSYSTGDTHKIVYAIGNNPYGPFYYKGVVLNPVLGWTNHHSIVEIDKKWYIFFHDSSMSGGKTHLRSVKFSELIHNDDGSIIPIDAMVKNSDK